MERTANTKLSNPKRCVSSSVDSLHCEAVRALGLVVLAQAFPSLLTPTQPLAGAAALLYCIQRTQISVVLQSFIHAINV